MFRLVAFAEPLKNPVKLARLGLRDAVLAQVDSEGALRRAGNDDNVGGGEADVHFPTPRTYDVKLVE